MGHQPTCPCALRALPCPGLLGTPLLPEPFWTRLDLHHSKGTLLVSLSAGRPRGRSIRNCCIPAPTCAPGQEGTGSFPSLVIGTSHLLGQSQAGSRPKCVWAEDVSLQSKTAPDGDDKQNFADNLENNLSIMDRACWWSLFGGNQMHSPNIYRKHCYQSTIFLAPNSLISHIKQ